MMLALVSSIPQIALAEPPSRRGSEADLVRRTIAGDQAALLDLYRAHQHRVRAFARRVLGSEGAADDLLHELFLALPRTLMNFRAESSLGSFLVGVAARRAKHHVRSSVRRRLAEDRAAHEPPASSRTPDRDLERRELAARLSAALAELPLDQRIAFVMCEVEERTSVEVAALLGERDGTIRGRLHLAKKKLREALASKETA
jgi:RNA polymerase sigma-70 factor (ECF subfamily)